jgi:hypothetical protein
MLMVLRMEQALQVNTSRNSPAKRGMDWQVILSPLALDDWK